MYAVVVKPFTANGESYTSGDMVDISDFPKGDTLKRTRYLRDATVDEVHRATGIELPAAPKAASNKAKSPAATQPVTAGKPKTVAVTVPVPLTQSRHARAKAARP